MPFFADVHPGGEVPIEVLLAALRAACASRRDPAGVRPVDYYVGTGGRITCVVEAPDAAAVRQLHATLGLPCRHIRQVPPPSDPT
jgi:Protein of unknown function (DUF4242)